MITQVFKNLLDNCFDKIIEISNSNIVYKISDRAIYLNYCCIYKEDNDKLDLEQETYLHCYTNPKRKGFCIHFNGISNVVPELSRIEHAEYLTKFENTIINFKNKNLNEILNLTSSNNNSNEEF